MLHIKNVKPLFTNLITTGERFGEDQTQGGIIVVKKGDLKPWQKVVAVGASVRDIKVGDTVMINLGNYAVKRYSKDSIQNDMGNNPTLELRLNWVPIDDEQGNPVDHLLLTDRDIEYVFEGEEKKDTIIMPDKPKIITN